MRVRRMLQHTLIMRRTMTRAKIRAYRFYGRDRLISIGCVRCRRPPSGRLGDGVMRRGDSVVVG